MQPEISRRCPACGASVRERALFCPNCGRPRSRSVLAAPEPTVEPVALERAPAEEVSSNETGSHEAKVSPTRSPAPESAGSAARSQSRGARDKLQRASTAARGTLEENVKRVEKIRHASSAVIEEASYDPSLRFVLVALALFVVFVVLLVLSKVMG